MAGRLEGKVAFLVSDDSRLMTAEHLNVDAGMHTFSRARIR